MENNRDRHQTHFITPLFKAVLLSILLLFCSISYGNVQEPLTHIQEPMRLDVDPEKLIIYDQSKQIAFFDVEIARTDKETSAGLMYRVDLPQNRGMLFVFGNEAMRFFWMENTPTPLDIIYAAADGTIVYIAQNTTPFSRTPIPSRLPAQYALEIHAGLSAMIGIKPGQKLEHPAIQGEK